MNEDWISFVAERLPELWLRLGQHVVLTGVSTGLAVIVGVPLGMLGSRKRWIRGPIIATAGILQTVPSLAMLTFLLAVLHRIGMLPAIVALTLYALLPIVRNTITGLEGVAADVMEAAAGVGMTPWQQMALVRVPLALPTMIAGVRTAAVMAVGVATLSAFIGAGGLGQFINRGLALANMRLILLGAIPAALLALAVDFAIGAAGWAVAPRHAASRRRPLAATVRVVTILLPLVLFAAGGITYLRQRPDMTIGSKNFTEQLVLGHMMAQIIEDRTDLTVDRRFCLGGTMICHGALENGEIDVYPEYTGTGLTTVLHQQPPADRGAVFETVARGYQQDFDLEWLAPFGLNNTYAITVRRADAEQNGWTSISDLRDQADRLRAGFTGEFVERPDGYPGLSEHYGLRFGEAVDIDPGLMYDAIAAGEVDVIAAFATDGRILEYDLVPLEDDLQFFPPYRAAPVARANLVENHPAAARALDQLAGILDDQTMQRLNYRVDHDQQSPAVVARDFLRARGLVGQRSTGTPDRPEAIE